MPYLIDSDWVIDFIERDVRVVQLLDAMRLEGVAISIITYMEVYQGIIRSSVSSDLQARLDRLLEGAPLLMLTPEAARRCARLRETLRRQGRRVNSRALDLINAAIALEYDLTLVTRNVNDFHDIPDLKLYLPN